MSIRKLAVAVFAAAAAGIGVFVAFASLAEAAQPSGNHQKRVRSFAALPDWTGIWEADAWSERTLAGKPVGGIERVRARSELMGHPPYNPEWEARYQGGLKSPGTLRAASQKSKSCTLGFPMVMESPAIFQIALTPEEALFVFVTQEVRHVYTDARPHAPEDERWLTRMGDSIGHWEGDTLVIETVARLPQDALAIASPLSKVSAQATFTERLRLVSADVLEDEMTIEDPVTLARPWTVKIRYRRVTDLGRMTNYDCGENDRNPVVDGKLTVVPSSQN
jgi:hypothetical protein